MTAQLEENISDTVGSCGFQYYGYEFHSGGGSGRAVLLVYIDAAEGVTIDNCAQVSRQLAAVLDVKQLISGAYDLQVSSPGIQRPLLRLAHYEPLLGEKIKLKLRQPQAQRRHFAGVLQQINGEQLTFLLDDGTNLIIDFAQVEKAKLLRKPSLKR